MRTRFRCVAIALIVGSTAILGAGQDRPPEQIGVGRSEPLRLWARAQRTHLLGTVGLYTVALYGDDAVDRARLASVDVAKALRIEVTYDDLQRRVAIDWRSELVPPLDPQPAAHLQGSVAPLRQGDVLQIDYVPGRGTTIRVNRAIAVAGAHHDLMLAFMDRWLGERPVSEEIKRTLLAGS
jgi:hypothetical protein